MKGLTNLAYLNLYGTAVTDAGLEAHFQTFDPALAPQPVLLKMGGGVRVLFVKISRAFEVSRTDFKQVVPFENQGKPAL